MIIKWGSNQNVKLLLKLMVYKDFVLYTVLVVGGGASFLNVRVKVKFANPVRNGRLPKLYDLSTLTVNKIGLS